MRQLHLSQTTRFITKYGIWSWQKENEESNKSILYFYLYKSLLRDNILSYILKDHISIIIYFIFFPADFAATPLPPLTPIASLAFLYMRRRISFHLLTSLYGIQWKLSAAGKDRNGGVKVKAAD